MSNRNIWKHFDFWLLTVVLFLCIFGVALIRSAVSGNIDLASHPQRQVLFLVLGLAVCFVVAWMDYRYWYALAPLLYIFTVFFLILVFVVGKASFGAARWLELGFVVIQPAELAKIAIILMLAKFFSDRQDETNGIKLIYSSLGVTFFVVIWILLQPNLSTSIVLMVLWFSMLWISGLKTKLIIIFSAIVIVFLIVSALLGFPYLEDYQKKRITNFMSQDADDPDARYGDTYNVDQALISIGSGGLLGHGYGQGSQVQLRFLKVRHTDFIFSVLAHEFGFVGTVIVLLLLMFVIFRCFRIAQKAPDRFGALIAFGFGFLMLFQTAVNVGVNLKLMPVTGLTLPFISAGGSSLMSMLLGIGIVESVAMRSKIHAQT